MNFEVIGCFDKNNLNTAEIIFRYKAYLLCARRGLITYNRLCGAHRSHQIVRCSSQNSLPLYPVVRVCFVFNMHSNVTIAEVNIRKGKFNIICRIHFSRNVIIKCFRSRGRFYCVSDRCQDR